MSIPSNSSQSPWWTKAEAPPAPAAPRFRGVAYYRHSARDRQENSVAIQQELVQKWATENGVDIIHEFSDRGKSGLTAEGRDEFNEMMEGWVKKRKDFDFVLCLDVSRWGRFQDIDLSATYSAECKKHGKQVIYTTLGMPRPDDPLIAHQRLGKTHIRAEVVTCTRKQAYLESLVENLARTRPGTMHFARELKSLHDEGWDFARIAKVACRSIEYIRQYIKLVEKGEERLIQGVEQDIIPISFAILVAQADDATIQHVLMDAFDQGIVNSANFARARNIINARTDRRNRQKGSVTENYTVDTLTEDISTATHAKDSFAREAQSKESRLYTLLDGLAELWHDGEFARLLQDENLAERPQLTGKYNVTTRATKMEKVPS